MCLSEKVCECVCVGASVAFVSECITAVKKREWDTSTGGMREWTRWEAGRKKTVKQDKTERRDSFTDRCFKAGKKQLLSPLSSYLV